MAGVGSAVINANGRVRNGRVMWKMRHHGREIMEVRHGRKMWHHGSKEVRHGRGMRRQVRDGQ